MKKELDIKAGKVFRIVKLWPHARKKGKEIGQLWEVMPCCPGCGNEVIWLKDKENKSNTFTVDQTFLSKHFTEQRDK